MTDLTGLAQALRQAVEGSCGISVADPTAPAPPLWPEEESAAAKMVDKRRREFAAGRTAARAAMTALDHPATSIPMGSDRAPLWPDALRGSIAHCQQVAIAIVAKSGSVSGLGIDIEEDAPLESTLWTDILTPVEQNWLRAQHPADQGRIVRQIFSAKEAVYKAQYPLTKCMLEFGDVSLAFENEHFTTCLDLPDVPKPISGRILRSEGFIVSLVVIG